MKAILIYASCYGSTRRYAGELSRRTGRPAVSYQNLPDLSPYDTVVHLGGMYAEKVLGLEETVKRLPPGARLIVVTVGLGDPAVPRTAERLKNNVEQQLPDELEAECFHLRGAMDPETLSPQHRQMIEAFQARLPGNAGEKNSGNKAALNRPADFVDFASLEPLIRLLKDQS